MIDEVVNDDILDNLDKIKISPIKINSKQKLTRKIARKRTSGSENVRVAS